MLADCVPRSNKTVGSGFVRVPHPRQYDMPASKPLEGDAEDAEIYSVSALHQLHCLVSTHAPPALLHSQPA